MAKTAEKNMTIKEVLEMDIEGIAPILQGAGMHCLGCAMASGEDIEQACAVHGIDADDLMGKINAHLSTT